MIETVKESFYSTGKSITYLKRCEEICNPFLDASCVVSQVSTNQGVFGSELNSSSVSNKVNARLAKRLYASLDPAGDFFIWLRSNGALRLNAQL